MTKVEGGMPHYKTGFFVACCTYLYRLLDDARYLTAASKCAQFAMESVDSKDGTVLFDWQEIVG
jgi:hypothetical protein